MPRTIVQALAFALGFWLALQVSPGTVKLARARGAAPAEAQLEASLLQAVNATRARHHMVPLRREPGLDAVARAHAADMARRGYLSHQSPEGTNPLDRLRSAGEDGFTLAAENIGRTSEAAPNRRILESWLASEDHRRNLLASAFNATGLAVIRAPDGALIYTQVYVTYPR